MGPGLVRPLSVWLTDQGDPVVKISGSLRTLKHVFRTLYLVPRPSNSCEVRGRVTAFRVIRQLPRALALEVAL